MSRKICVVLVRAFGHTQFWTFGAKVAKNCVFTSPIWHFDEKNICTTKTLSLFASFLYIY